MRLSRVEWIALLVAIMAIPCMSFSFGSLFRGSQPAEGYVRTKAYVEESPEIGFGFQKVPVMVRVPTIVFRKKKTLVTRPVALPLCQGCSNGQVQVQNSPRPAAVSSYPSPVKSGKSQTYTSNVIFPESYDQYGNDDYSP